MGGIPWKLLTAGVLTALLLELPFPIVGPLPVWRTVFAWFGIVPLLAGLLRYSLTRESKPLRWAFLAGWLTGALWFGFNCYWIYNTVRNYGGMNPPVAAISMVIFSLYYGLWMALFAFAFMFIRRATAGKRVAWLAPAMIPVLWTAMEYGLAHICRPEFPWDLLGYSQVENGLLTRIAPWTGVMGISFLLAGANALFSVALAQPRIARRFSAFSPAAYCGSLGAVILLVGLGGFAMHPPQPKTEATAMLLQPNLDVGEDNNWAGTEWDRWIAHFDQFGGSTCKPWLAGLPETNAKTIQPDCPNPAPYPALIVWPESPAPFHELDDRFHKSMAAIAADNHAPMIVGSVGMDFAPNLDRTGQLEQRLRLYNSAQVVNQDGHFGGRYDKRHLVPFGEYIPARWLFFFAKQITQTMTDLTTGDEPMVFRIGSTTSTGKPSAHRYGVFICYESVFGDEVRQFSRLGAEVLVNISDDGWYGDSSAPWQHLNMARMRAIENRRWILRDTNNGVTASIDPYGAVRQSIARHQVDALAAAFAFNSEITFYTQHGDLLPALCAILSLALVVWSVRVLLGEIAAKSSSKTTAIRP